MPGSAVQVRELVDAREGEWDAFVFSCEEATFFHRAGWRRVIERSFGHRSHYLYAERDGSIVGVLPLTHITSALVGRSLVSTGFCVYGGPAGTGQEAVEALDDAARALAAELDVDFVEYRHRLERRYSGTAVKSDLYVTFRKSIDADVEKNMLSIPRKQRAMVRKGIKLDLQSDIASDCRHFHRVYSESVRNLGTPVFPRSYFEELIREFGPDCEVLVVSQGGRPISAVMTFFFRDEVLPYYGGGTSRARELAGNDFMYWEVMRRACERGARLFDFGRSKRGTGAFDFKKNWGFEPQPLFYSFIMRRGQKPPDINPLNPKFRTLVEIWKRLPLPVANFIGPHIVRHFG
jgi:FemAB-related protein (PEP-CTERM system-associated)